MGRILRNGFAVLNGSFYRFACKVFPWKNVKCGRRLFKFRHVSARANRDSSLRIGDNVKLNTGSLLSSLNGGKLTIGDHVGVGQNDMIVCHEEIDIGKGTLFGPNVLIYDHDHAFDSEIGVERKKFKTAPISIGENCWIGANVVILRGTKIGNRCVVAAGSVIKGSFEDNSLIVQRRETEVTVIHRKAEKN